MIKNTLAVVFMCIITIANAQQDTIFSSTDTVICYRITNEQKQKMTHAQTMYYRTVEQILNSLKKEVQKSDINYTRTMNSYIDILSDYTYNPNINEIIKEYNYYLKIRGYKPFLLKEKEETSEVKYAVTDRTQDDKSIFQHNKYGALYIGRNYNDVANQLSDYLQQTMQLTQSDVSLGKSNEIITKYITKIGEKKYLTTSFYIDKESNITKIIITGNWELIVNLFAKYWPTRIKFDNKEQNATASCKAGSDNITIISQYPKATIHIK